MCYDCPSCQSWHLIPLYANDASQSLSFTIKPVRFGGAKSLDQDASTCALGASVTAASLNLITQFLPNRYGCSNGLLRANTVTCTFEDNHDKRANPALLVEGTQSIISVRLDYLVTAPPRRAILIMPYPIMALSRAMPVGVIIIKPCVGGLSYLPIKFCKNYNATTHTMPQD